MADLTIQVTVTSVVQLLEVKIIHMLLATELFVRTTPISCKYSNIHVVRYSVSPVKEFSLMNVLCLHLVVFGRSFSVLVGRAVATYWVLQTEELEMLHRREG